MDLQSAAYPESGDWFSQILAKAIESRASDIHFEPGREEYVVRFRVDGLLVPAQKFSKTIQDNIISRLKVLAKIDITNHFLPQDGHFEFNYQEAIYNVRISTLPSLYGEAIVLRIFNRGDLLISVENLGFEPEQYPLLTRIIKTPSGINLVTGSTGSGKTTLLYSILNNINSGEKNIITIEDPIEYQLSNIRQVQVNDSQEFTFARALRSVLRQDPDAIMLGEIRDSETAQMAFQASLTGILVLSTFHTFDLPALTMRLKEMGIELSVIAQALNGVITSKLLRTICNSCRETYTPEDKEKQILGATVTQLYRGRGCEQCNNTGYFGRLGMFEIICFDDEVKAAIIEEKPATYMYEMLRKKRVVSMNDIAMKRILQGVTTLNEAMRIIGLINFTKTMLPSSSATQTVAS